MKFHLITLSAVIIGLSSFGGFNCASNTHSIAISRRSPSLSTITSVKTNIVVSNPPIASTTAIAEDFIEETETPKDTIKNDSENLNPTMPAAPSTTDPKSTGISSDIDPTDYSTVWPTRWRPRGRRFGAQGDAHKPTPTANKWILILLNFAFIGGIFL